MTQVNKSNNWTNCPSVMTETTLLAWERIRDSSIAPFCSTLLGYYQLLLTIRAHLSSYNNAIITLHNHI